MPANWSLPVLSTAYATVLTTLDERLDDAVSLFNTDGTNIPENSLKYDRVGNKFQERISAAWVDKVLAVAGGGTGSATAAGARTNLGLGSMATQNANAVAITGGTISGLTSLAVSGNITATGTISGDGSLLTNLAAGSIATGTVATARLGSGTASSSTFLRGDQTWATPLGTVPSGLIALFDTACPSGWTRFTALDAKFPRGASSYGGTGGAATHTHTIDSVGDHTHGTTGSTADTSIAHGHTGTTSTRVSNVAAGSGVSAATGDHNHTFSTDVNDVIHSHGAGSLSATAGGGHTHTEQSASSLSPYLDMVFCKKD